MLTIFTIPKAFVPPFDVLQRNAIESWTRLGESVRVILLGDDAGTAQCAQDHGLEHVPQVKRNGYGTPLLDDLFALAEAASVDDYLCYVNADIILMNGFVRAFEIALDAKKRFLMVGQRTDFDPDGAVCFDGDWERRLQQDVTERGQLHRPTGIDYFLFRRAMWGVIPPFAIGRFSWDNWLLHRARQLKVPIIDATRLVTAVHQNHDYSHARGGQRGAMNGSEAHENYRLAGGRKLSLTIWDSTHVLDEQGVHQRQFDAALGGGIWSYRRFVG